MSGEMAIKMLAKRNGTSEGEIRREIQRCIDEAMNSADPTAQAIWKTIPRKGERVTAEELIEWAAKRVRERRYS